MDRGYRSAPADTTATDHATRFRQLHEAGVLVLPNAWDATSARLIEDAGAHAIAARPSTSYAARSRLRETSEQAGRIRTVREVTDATGVPLFVNARIDTYLRQVGDPAGRLDETVSRARAYIDAGADGIFVPGLLDAEMLRELAGLLPVPLNVMGPCGRGTRCAGGCAGSLSALRSRRRRRRWRAVGPESS